MSLIKEMAFQLMDPAYDPNIKGLNLGEVVENKVLTLNSKRQVDFKSLLANGPLILIFIRGTWCPFCRMHMQRLSKWLDRRKNDRGTCVVVSSESIENINNWLANNPFSYMFASDVKMELSDYFGVHIAPRDFSQAATFLIDQDFKIKMAYKGRRTNKNFKEVDKALS